MCRVTLGTGHLDYFEAVAHYLWVEVRANVEQYTFAFDAFNGSPPVVRRVAQFVPASF